MVVSRCRSVEGGELMGSGDTVRVDGVLFDVFGTLVERSADHDVTYARTLALLVEWGHDLTAEELAHGLGTAWDGCEATAAACLQEFPAVVAIEAFAATLARPLAPPQVDELCELFHDEWCAGLQPVEGAVQMIERMAGDVRLGVVSNTSHTELVPRLLDQLGFGGAMDVVVLSIVHGARKPHPSIYRSALEALGTSPASTVFVGDSYGPDFVGPTDQGLHAFLIDPDGRHAVPAGQRLATVTELEDRLF